MTNYLFYIRKRLAGKKGMLIFNIIVLSSAWTLLCLAAAIPLILSHGEYSIRKALGDPVERYGVVRADTDITGEQGSDYIVDLYDEPEIEGVGTWTYGGFEHLTTVGGGADLWDRILEIQNSYVKEFDDDPEYVQVVFMPGQAFRINDLELYQGSAEQVGHNEGYQIYLGYCFKEIPIGTVFEDEVFGERYVVEGVLRKNSSIVDGRGLLMNYGGLRLRYSVDMDNMVLIVPPWSDNYLSSVFLFKCSEGYTYSEAAEKIKAIAERHGFQVETGTLQKRVDDVLSDVDWLIDTIVMLSVLLSFSAFIIVLNTQLLTILSRKDELGVWLISGMGRKKIFRILWGENMIKMFLSSAISYGIVLLCFKNILQDASPAVIYGLHYITWGVVPALLLVCTVLMALLCSTISMAYVKKKSVPDIVRGTWE